MKGDRTKMRCTIDGEAGEFEDAKDAFRFLGIDKRRHDLRPLLRQSPTRSITVPDRFKRRRTIRWIN